MGLSLVAFDTDHIKQYVFGTNKLKEIRGASSLLDRLNRGGMKRVAYEHRIDIIPIYTNGGSGLFLVDAEDAEKFGQLVQQAYNKQSQGKASITFIVQEIPNNIEDVRTASLSNELKDMLKDYPPHIQAIMTHDLSRELELMRYRLREAKACPPGMLYANNLIMDVQIEGLKTPSAGVIALPSHPFIRSCDSCGIEYAERSYQETPDEPAAFYCASCREKQIEDDQIKSRISTTIHRIDKEVRQTYLWDRILSCLKTVDYSLPPDLAVLDRPNDFNEFRLFARSKEYLGLIYADANNMGKQMEELQTLIAIRAFADNVDDHIHLAMSLAIKKHLPIVEVTKEGKSVPLFPFDILLVGGDDIVMVTDATKTMDVALSIAQEFHRLSNYTLSIGVVLAPVKYPFGLLREIVEGALKFAKSESAKARARGESDDTRINFLIVAGGSSSDFKSIFNATYHMKDDARKKRYVDNNSEFYATLRPYKIEDLRILLDAIHESKVKKLNLGRTKLHQLREAVLEMNLTTAINEGLALLRNWRDKERSYVVRRVYEFGGRYQMPRSNPRDPASGFPRIIFPWFIDGKNKDGQDIYRTPLLDFIELYDFVSREEEESSDED
jgi:hypothetical protein